jgi:hypothetical protein
MYSPTFGKYPEMRQAIYTSYGAAATMDEITFSQFKHNFNLHSSISNLNPISNRCDLFLESMERNPVFSCVGLQNEQ